MGARGDATAPSACCTTAGGMQAKKKKSRAAGTRENTDDNPTAAASSGVAPTHPAADADVGAAPEKGERKVKKQRRYKEESQGASSSCGVGVLSDSSGEHFRVLIEKKKRKQRLDECDPSGDHPTAAAADATAPAPLGGERATEREKKRWKSEQKAVVEGCAVSSNSSSSNSTCCSSASAASDRKGTPSAAASAKRKEKVKEDSVAERGKHYTAREVKEDAETIPVADTTTTTTPATAACRAAPAAAAAEGVQPQGGQLSAYKLSAVTLEILERRGIQQLLPIQAATFSAVRSGKDLIGRADTGTGKTLAFALPLVERLLSTSVSSSSSSHKSGNPSDSGSISGKGEGRGVRLLVLLPTRELAQQVHAEFLLLLQDRLRAACVHGGGSGAAAATRQQQYSWQKTHQQHQRAGKEGQLQQQQQLEDLRRGRCSILVGCPGRVKDVINRGLLQQGAALQSVVLDEADRLLDMGFREDVEEILQWCRNAWNQSHSRTAPAALKTEEEEQEERENTAEVVKRKKSAEAGDSHEWRATRSLLSGSSGSSSEALQFLLFTATLPHWARSIASRFMRPDRLLVDAATLSPSGSSSGSPASRSSSKTKTGEASPDEQQHQEQQQVGRRSQGITYLVLFCPWKNRVRVLENILTVYGGCAAALDPDSAASPSLSCWTAGAAAGSPPAATGGGVGGGGAVVPGERVGAAAVIFAETKQQVNQIAFESGLRRLAAPLHGDLPQQQRETTLHAFKSGCFPYLVATDVAARGLHVENLPLVVQLSPPRDLDSFVHRAGRTGRAGKAGVCLTFAAVPDIPTLLALEKKLNMQFKRVGVPQPSGIQRYLLNMQLQRILPQTAGTAQRECREGLARVEQVVGDAEKKTKRRGREKEKEEVDEEEQSEESFGAAAAGGGDFAAGEGDGRRTEEEKQISDAADRVLQALPPREAVRRCLTLLLRQHPAAGSTGAAAGAAAAAHSTAGSFAGGASSSLSACAGGAADEDGVQPAAAGEDRLSCLNGREGYRTYVLRKRELRQQHEEHDGGLLRSPGQVWRLLKGALLYQRNGGPRKRAGSYEISSVTDHVEDLLERIHSLTLTADGRGAVFDVASADVPAFAAHVLQRCCDQPPEDDCCCEGATGGTAATPEGRRAAARGGVPFVIREAEELPELVDALALRRSEQSSGGRTQQDGGGYQYLWNGGRGRGGGAHSSGSSRTWRTPGSSFRSASERWTQQQRSGSWTATSNSRGGSSSNSRVEGARGRGGGGGRGGSGSSSRGGRFSGAHREAGWGGSDRGGRS